MQVSDDRKIVVFGKHEFRAADWRKAINFFLDGIWSSSDDALANPAINFDGLILSRVKEPLRYVLRLSSGHHEKPRSSFINNTQSGEFVRATSKCEEVEVALAMFVRDNKRRILEIFSGNWGRDILCLWKNPKRSDLGICLGKPEI